DAARRPGARPRARRVDRPARPRGRERCLPAEEARGLRAEREGARPARQDPGRDDPLEPAVHRLDVPASAVAAPRAAGYKTDMAPRRSVPLAGGACFAAAALAATALVLSLKSCSGGGGPVSGGAAMKHVKTWVNELGPCPPGSESLKKKTKYI